MELFATEVLDTLTLIINWVGLSLLLTSPISILALYLSVIRIPPGEYGVVTAKYLPWKVDNVTREYTDMHGVKRKYRFNQGFVPKWYNGLWAYKLHTGLRFLFLWRLWGEIEMRDLPFIPEGKRGMFIAMAGKEIPDGEIMVVKYCDPTYGQTFLKDDYRGPLAVLGSPGFHNVFGCVLNPGKEKPPDGKMYLFHIKLVDSISIGTVPKKGLNPNNPEEEIWVPQLGLIKSNVGRHIEGESFSEEGEIVADLPEPVVVNGVEYNTHKNFTDPIAFVAMSGSMGNQREFLENGEYFIHPVAFECTVVEATVVSEGRRAVLISRIGKSASDEDFVDEYFEDNESGRKQKIPVLKPEFDLKNKKSEKLRQGILSRSMGPGVYPLNLFVVRAILVDTTPIHISENVNVISEELFDLKLSVELIFRIMADDTPKVLTVSGSVDELLKDTVIPRLQAIVFNESSKTGVKELAGNREDFRAKIISDSNGDGIKKILEKRFCRFMDFRVSGFDGSGDKGYAAYEALRAREINAELEKQVLEVEIDTEKKRVELAYQQALRNGQRIIVDADLQRQAADKIKDAITIRGNGLNEVINGMQTPSEFAKVAQILSIAHPGLFENLVRVLEEYLKKLNSSKAA